MRYAWLGFVLVIPLLACPGDDEGETAASTTSNGNTSAATSTPTSTGGETTATDSTGPSGTTTAAESSGPPADGSSTTAGGTSSLDACLATCNRLVECMLEDVPNCGIPCSSVPAMVAGCSDEYVAQQECAAALTCDELQAWVDAMVQPGEHPCEVEDDAYRVCETGATTGG